MMASGFHNLPRKSNKVRLPLISLWALFLFANLWIFTVTIIIIIIFGVIIITITTIQSPIINVIIIIIHFVVIITILT